jgi:hypothetical protein
MKNLLRTRTLLALLCGWSTCCGVHAEESPRPLKVFVFAGQSNMAGLRSNATELKDTALAGPQDNLSFFNGEWVPLAPGTVQNVPTSTIKNREERLRQGFGPEVSFASQVSQALGEPVGVVKLALGRTSLHRQWQPGKANGLYEQLRQMVQDASKQRPVEVIGMLWMQGESDAKAPAEAKAYADNLRNLVETARRDFGNPGMIFVAGRINLPGPEDPASMETVREALAGQDLKDYGWVDCDDLTTVSDRLHFDTRGLEELGSRMAAAFLRLHNPNQEPGKTDASE